MESNIHIYFFIFNGFGTGLLRGHSVVEKSIEMGSYYGRIDIDRIHQIISSFIGSSKFIKGKEIKIDHYIPLKNWSFEYDEKTNSTSIVIYHDHVAYRKIYEENPNNGKDILIPREIDLDKLDRLYLKQGYDNFFDERVRSKRNVFYFVDGSFINSSIG